MSICLCPSKNKNSPPPLFYPPHPFDSFEVKLVLLDFISRLIGCHKLLLLNFYSHVQRYVRRRWISVNWMDGLSYTYR